MSTIVSRALTQLKGKEIQTVRQLDERQHLAASKECEVAKERVSAARRDEAEALRRYSNLTRPRPMPSLDSLNSMTTAEQESARRKFEQEQQAVERECEARQTAERALVTAQNKVAAAKREAYKRVLGAADRVRSDAGGGHASDIRIETCNFEVVQKWLWSERDTLPPKMYCPICRDVEFDLASFKPAGFTRPSGSIEARLNVEEGIVTRECQHILGKNCFTRMRADARDDATAIPCPTCNEMVIPNECKSLEQSVLNEFHKIAVEERQKMPWP